VESKGGTFGDPNNPRSNFSYWATDSRTNPFVQEMWDKYRPTLDKPTDGGRKE
jgi:hypothetical protein